MSENNSIRLSLDKLDLRLRPLRVLTESSIQSMCKSLEKRSQITPLVVAMDGAVHILIDGFKRQRAAEILGLTTVMVIIIPFKDAMMKAQMYILNKSNGFSMIEECMLIRELIDKDGLNQVEVGAILDRHKSWVSRRLAIVRSLASQIVEDIKLGLIPAGSAGELARLQQCNQADLCSIIQTHRLSAKQGNRLIDLWCKTSDPQAREFIVKSPILALELANPGGGVKLDPRIPPFVCGWVKTIYALERIAVNLQLRSKKQIGHLDYETYKILHEALKKADKECQEAVRIAEQTLFNLEEKSNESLKRNATQENKRRI